MIKSIDCYQKKSFWGGEWEKTKLLGRPICQRHITILFCCSNLHYFFSYLLNSFNHTLKIQLRITCKIRIHFINVIKKMISRLVLLYISIFCAIWLLTTIHTCVSLQSCHIFITSISALWNGHISNWIFSPPPQLSYADLCFTGSDS